MTALTFRLIQDRPHSWVHKSFMIPTEKLSLSNREVAQEVRSWAFRDIALEHEDDIESMKKSLKQAEASCHDRFRYYENLKARYEKTGILL